MAEEQNEYQVRTYSLQKQSIWASMAIFRAYPDDEHIVGILK